MLELLSDIPFVSLFIKFMIASTVLMGTVWLMEKARLINTPDLAELAWKLAIVGSFVAILPIADLVSAKWVIEDNRTAALIDGLNENRPLSDLAPERTQKPEPLTITVDSNSSAALMDAKRAIEAAQARLGENKDNTKLTTETVDGDGQQFSFANGNKSSRITVVENENGDPRVTLDFEPVANTKNADTAQFTGPEYDSEPIENNPFWYSAADLRTKDLAAIGWAALALLTVGALMVSYRDAVRNLGSRQRVEAESRPNQVLRAVCAKADIRHVPYLSRSSAIKSPVCLPGKEICLPEWAFDDMPETEFKSLLAHELGHMVRKDPMMLMALQMLSRIFFFQPLFIIARKRLTDIAELAADEWAANQAADSRAVANALFTCATKIHETRQIQWGLAMAGNKSILRQRVERLIHAQSVPFKTAGTFAKSALGVGVIGLSLGLPSIEFAGAMTAEGSMGNDIDTPVIADIATAPTAARNTKVTSIPRVAPFAAVSPQAPEVPATSTKEAPFATAYATAVAEANTTAVAVANAESAAAHPHGNYHVINRHDNSGNMNWSDGDNRISVKWEGSFKIVEGDTFIEPEDDEGYLRIKTRGDDTRRSIKFKVADGKRTTTYKVDGKEKPLDADGKKWLKASVRLLIEAGFGAEQRVARILKKSKVKGVLKEVSGFKRDFAKRIYLTELMDQAKLSSKEISQVIDITAQFKSDFEKRLTLSVMLEEENVSDKMLPKVLKVAKSFDSDFEKRLLVTHFVSEIKLNDKTTGMVIDIAESIDSDFELRLLLTAALGETRLSNKNVQRILDMAIKSIDSNFEKRILLSAFADEYDRSDAVVSKVLDAAASIDSAFERRILLSAIITEAKMNEKNWLKAIEVASKIDSSFERAHALRHIQSEVPKKNKKVSDKLAKTMEGMKNQPDARGLVFPGNDGNSFAFGEDFAIEFAGEFASEFTEAMSELAEEMAELEMEQAELMRGFENPDSDISREAIRAHSRVLRAKQREMRNVMRNQRNMERQVEREVARAEKQAVRQIEREIRNVKREMSHAGKGLERELSDVVRQLERSKVELMRQLEHRKKRTELRIIEEKKQKERKVEEQKDTQNSDNPEL